MIQKKDIEIFIPEKGMVNLYEAIEKGFYDEWSLGRHFCFTTLELTWLGHTAKCLSELKVPFGVLTGNESIEKINIWRAAGAGSLLGTEIKEGKVYMTQKAAKLGRTGGIPISKDEMEADGIEQLMFTFPPVDPETGLIGAYRFVDIVGNRTPEMMKKYRLKMASMDLFQGMIDYAKKAPHWKGYVEALEKLRRR